MLRLVFHVFPIGGGAFIVFFESAILIMLGAIGTDLMPPVEQRSMFQQPGPHIGLLIMGLALFAVGLRTEAWSLRTSHRVAGSKVCWFCDKRPEDDASICEVKMHRKVDEKSASLLPVAFLSFGSIQYQKKVIKIPRCRICKNIHGYQKIGNVLYVVASFGMMGALASVCALYLEWQTWIEVTMSIFAWIIFVGLCACMAILLPVKSPKDSPQVKHLLKEGWEIGEKPGN